MTEGILSQMANARKCPRDQSFMVKQPGLWVLQQVQRDGGLIGSNMVRPTGQMLTVFAHVCPACGHVELVNEGGA